MSKVTAALLVLSVIVSESQMRQQYKKLLIIYPKMDILVEGYRLPNKALTNHELVEAAKALNITNFKGVFMRNNLPKTPKKTRVWYPQTRLLKWIWHSLGLLVEEALH